MAEIRKHNPDSGNAIAQALRAALGENVRPHTPGVPAETTPRTDLATGPAPSHTTTYNLSVRTQVVVTPEDQDD